MVTASFSNEPMAGIAAIVDVLPLGGVKPLVCQTSRLSVNPREADLLIPIRESEASINAAYRKILCGGIPLTLIPKQASCLVNSFDCAFAGTSPAIAYKALNHLDHFIECVSHRVYR
jgi:hypothetical protein